MTDQRRDITTRAMTVRAGSFDEATRSVRAVVTTDHPVQVFDMARWEVIDEVLVADGGTFPESLRLLDSHNRSSINDIAGSVRDFNMQDGEGGKLWDGRLEFASNAPLGETAMHLARQGHLTDVSLGYRVDQYLDIPAGQSAPIEGRTYTAGARALRVSTKWTAREVSLVPIGADERAKVREESSGKEATTMEQNRKEAEGVAPVVATPEPQAVATTPDVGAIRAEAIKAERDRIRQINELGAGAPADIRERAIAEGTSVPDAAIAFLGAQNAARAKASTSAPAGIVRDGERDGGTDVLAASLLMRASGENVGALERIRSVAKLSKQDRARAAAELADKADRFRRISLIDVCREAGRIMGCDVAHGYDPSEMFRTVLLADAERFNQRGTSGAAFTGIFTSVASAMMLASYEMYPDTTAGWTSEADLPDFKLTDRVRLATGTGLERVGRGKEANHASYADVLEQYRIARYAKQWVVDEQDIIDDTLGGLSKVPADMAAQAAQLRPDLVYAIMLANAALSDGVVLFHAASHTNLGTGSTSALSTDSAAVGLAAMAKQTENGRSLNLRAGFAIVPQDLRFAAIQTFKSTNVVSNNVTNTPSLYGNINALAGENIQIVSDNRIGVAGVTDPVTGTAYAGTATNWFLAAEGGRNTIEVGYLRGARTPTLRSEPLTRGRWGVGFDIKHDIGAKALDYRGLYKSNGA